MVKSLNTNFFSYSIVFSIFFILIFLLVTPDKSFAQTNCTTFVISVGSPPCETPAYNLDCTMSVGFPFPSDYVTGDRCAETYNQVCVETKSLFNWTGERCDPTPTPTPTLPPPCIERGPYFGACTAASPNTCSVNNGTQTVSYDCQTGYSQTCTVDACDATNGYSCLNGICVTPTLIPPTPTPTPTPGQCQTNSDCGTPANSCTTVYCLGAPNGICVYNPAPAGTVCDTNGSVCDGSGTCLVPTPTPTPVPCQVTTSPSVHNLAVGGTGTVTASVTSGQGSAIINQMRFGSYDTAIATVNPTIDSTSIYSTTVTAIAGGATAVWGTADLSDGRTCQSSGMTDTDINVSTTCPPGTIYNISGTVTGQPSGKKLTVCRDPNTPGSCVNAASSTTTNPANGSYTLSNISSDTYHLIYLDPTSLPVNYSVSSANPVNVSSNTCPSNVNFTISTGTAPTPTPTRAPIGGGPTATPAPPTPTSPPFSSSCNYIDPSTITNNPTVTLQPDGHTLNITYSLVGVSNPSVTFYRNSTPGFLASTPPSPSTLFSTQFGNYGSNFHTGIQYPLNGGGGNYYNYYNYQLVKTSSGGTSYSNPSSVLVQKPNLAPCDTQYGYNPGTISGASQVSSTDTSITFDLSYHSNGWPFPLNSLPPYLKIQRSSQSTPSYIPFNSYTSSPPSFCSGYLVAWWGSWACNETTWKARYTLSLPPATSDDLTVSSFDSNSCGTNKLNGSATFGVGTQEGQAPALGANPTLTTGQAENNVSASWTPTQDAVDVQAYYTEGALNRWPLAGGTQLASPTWTYNPPAYTFTTTDNLNLLLPGTYYYGATVYYATVCSGGTVQTDQTVYDWTGKFYTVSGNVFVDTNKNRLKDPGEQNYTGAITISSSTGSVAYQGNGNFKVSDLPEGTYTISYTSLPTGYQISYPVNGPPPGFFVTVGTACSVGSSNSATCIGQGDIKDLNFGITNLIPWIQSVGLDLRIDSGFNSYIPASALQPYASILGTGGSPGIIFSGDNSYDFGQGQASPSPYDWIVGGFTYPEIFVPKQLGVIQTSYAYQIDTADKNGLTPSDIAAYCTGGISDCTLSSALPHGLYLANGNLTINSSYAFGANQNYIILVNGDLTLNGNITVPNGSTVTFSVSGNINAAKNVTNIQGYYSADGNFIVQGTNNCSIASDVQLKAEGSVVVNAGQNGGTFQNQRDLCANDTTTPAVQFIERPDFIINAPQLIQFTRPIQKEVAP